MDFIQDFILGQLSTLNHFFTLNGKVPDAWRYYLVFSISLASIGMLNRVLNGFGTPKDRNTRKLIGFLILLILINPLAFYLGGINTAKLYKLTEPEYNYPDLSMLWRFVLVGIPIYFMLLTIINWQRDVRSHPFLAYVTIPVALVVSVVWAIIRPVGSETSANVLITGVLRTTGHLHYQRSLPKWYCAVINSVALFVYRSIYSENMDDDAFAEVVIDNLVDYNDTLGRARNSEDFIRLLDINEGKLTELNEVNPSKE